MDIVGIVALPLGIALAARYGWQRFGSSPSARAWAESDEALFDPPGVLVIRPLFAVVLLCAGLIEFLGWSKVLAYIGGAGVLLAFLYIVLPIPIPRWAKPRWYREFLDSADLEPRA